jgi:glycolate oxidase FAD binding subunit
VLTAPAGVRERVDLWGPVPGLELMRRVKAQFDPDGRFAPGRFVEGI